MWQWLLICATAVGFAVGQTTTGDIVGTVRDSSGAVVPGAKVTLTDVATGAVTETTTNESGDYLFPLLRPGRYNLTAEKEGFQKSTVSDIQLQVGYRVRMDLTLQVGAVTETVEVYGGAVLLETQSAIVGQVVDEVRARELPLNGRNFMQLALISAGVVPIGIGNSPVTAWTGRADQSASISGQRESSNSYLLDGIETRNARFGSTGIRPSVDAIQEFRIMRNTFSAEFGRGTAIINTAMKSGGNEFYGVLFHYLRNNKLDARNFFDLGPRPPFQQNNFGGSLGGRIVRDRLFHFFNYEGFRQRLGRELRGFYPTPQQLAGDLSGIRDSAGNLVVVRDPFTGAPFPNNQIPQARFSQVARNLIQYVPAPNLTGDERFNTVRRFSRQNDFDQTNTRVDYNLSERDHVFVRFSWADESIYVPALAPLRGERFPQSNHNVAGTYTRQFSPTVFNELRVGYNRSRTFRVSEASNTRNYAREVGLKNTSDNPFTYGVPQISIGGFDQFGSISQSIGAIDSLYQLTDNLSWVRGRHTIKAGADVRILRYFQDTNFAGNPSFSFSGQYACQPDPRGGLPRGCGIAEFLLGTITGLNASVGDSRQHLRSYFTGLYIQDDFRITPRLTLNLGLRYEFEAPPWERDNRGKILDFSTLTLKLAGRDTRRGLVYPDKNNFQPRVGLAWSPRNTTAVRVGFGVYGDLVNWNEQQFSIIGPPFFQSVSLQGRADRPDLLLDEMLPRLDFAPQPTVFTLDQYNRNPYVFQWNLNIQQTLARNFVFEAGYMGSASRKLGQRVNPNAGLPDEPGGRTYGLTVPLANRRPWPQFGDILYSYNGGNANYNALTLRAEKTFSQGYSVLASYTWSKAIDFGHTDEFATHWNFRHLDRGLSTFDARHRIVLSFLYELPFGKGKPIGGSLRGPAGFLVSGWQVNGIASFQSGQPRSVPHSGLAPIAGSFVVSRANRVGPGNCSECRRNIRKNPVVGPWFRLTDFQVPEPRTFGNAGRNILIAPGINNWDLSVLKNMQLAENTRLQFRAEFFNAFNHAQFGPPVTSLADPNYGRILSANEPRDIQFALRLEFGARR